MSTGSSMRRAVERAQGTFEARQPARGTTTIPVRSGFTGRLKGPRRTLPMRLQPGASPKAAPSVPETRERVTAGGILRKVGGALGKLFRRGSAKGV